jgi:hypothetical protein
MKSWKLAERALKLLNKSLPALKRGHDLLIVPPLEHILRGFALEIDFETKGAVRLWRVVMPLYRPPTFLILNYSDRLLGGEKVSVLEADLDRTLERVARVISQGELAYLQGIRSPEDFLQKIDWNSRPATPNYRMDLALTHYLAGNVSECLQILEQLAFAELSPRWADNVGLARELAEELTANPAAFDRRIKDWEDGNIGWFQSGVPHASEAQRSSGEAHS